MANSNYITVYHNGVNVNANYSINLVLPGFSRFRYTHQNNGVAGGSGKIFISISSTPIGGGVLEWQSPVTTLGGVYAVDVNMLSQSYSIFVFLIGTVTYNIFDMVEAIG